MNSKAYRLAAMAAMSCAVAFPLAACSAGITNAGPARSSSPTPDRTASSAGTAHPATPPPGTVRTVTVNGPMGSFPIPARAKVLENVNFKNKIIIILSSVSPAGAANFYRSALPQAGYKITLNTLVTGSTTHATGPVSEIGFTGHEYKGIISAISGVSTPGLNLGKGKNFVGITLTHK